MGINVKGVGVAIASGLAAVGAALGLKSWYDRNEQEKADMAVAQAEEAIELRQSIALNQAKMRAISEQLGEVNPKGNFRSAVRGAGAGAGVDSSTTTTLGQPNFNG